MPTFVFSNHALRKFIFFKKHKIYIRRKDVGETVLKGKVTDASKLPVTESTGEFDAFHSLVVIYRKIRDGFFIITFWIAEKGRYERKIQ